MIQTVNIKVLNLQKDLLILRLQFVKYLINNHILALERINEAEIFVNAEFERVNNQKINSPNLKAHLFVHIPSKSGSSNYLGFNDFVNFSTNKAEVIIDNDEKRNLFLDNYNFAIESWNKARDKIQRSEKMLRQYMEVLSTNLILIEDKINNALYDENEDLKEIPSKKTQKNKFESLAKMYLSACKKLNISYINPYQLKDFYPEGPSKSTWDRNLENPIILLIINKMLDKKINNSNLNKSDLELWVNVRENVLSNMEKAANKISKNKEIPIEDKLNYFNSNFDSMSQSTENQPTNWDEIDN